MIERKQHDANNKEEGKLEENCGSAGQQGRNRLPLTARRQQPLHNQLIGTVARCRQERSAD